ncbi:MAG: hypothetical protein WA459_11205 [Stellaceae bacterium]
MLTHFSSAGGARVGSVAALLAARSRGAAQRLQKLFSGGFSALQRVQKIGSGAPQWPQNLMPAGLSAWHRGHVMRSLRKVLAAADPSIEQSKLLSRISTGQATGNRAPSIFPEIYRALLILADIGGVVDAGLWSKIEAAQEQGEQNSGVALTPARR